MKNLLLSTFALISFTTAQAQVPSWLPANGLVAWYPFNGNPNDESNNGNNGTANGGAALTTDRLGNSNSAYTFNGTSSYIEVPDAVSLRSTRISIAMWVKVNGSISGTYQLAYKAGITNAQGEAYSMRAVGGSYGFDFKMNSNCTPNNGWKTSSYGTVQSTWVFLTSTYGGDSVRNYVNGAWVSSKYYPGNMDTCLGGNLRFGYTWNSYPTPLNGDLDDIAIYNRALSVCEIQQLYTQSSAAVTTQPATQTVLNGSAVHFNISVGAPASNLYYQWQQNTGSGFVSLANGGIYSNTNTASLTISPINTSINNAIYRCIVGSTSVCPDTSDEATLKINFSGVEEMNKELELTIAPNPTKDVVTITCNNYSYGQQFAITDQLGQTVLRGRIEQGPTQLDIKALAAGVYYFKLAGLAKAYKISKY